MVDDCLEFFYEEREGFVGRSLSVYYRFIRDGGGYNLLILFFL